MALAQHKHGLTKFFVTCWAFVECILLSGLGYAWGSFVFIFKKEGIYSNVCDTHADSSNHASQQNDRGDSVIYRDGANESIPAGNVSAWNKENDLFPTCKEQDSLMSLCFTIGIMISCLYSVVIGHFNYKLGTRIPRLFST